MEDIFDYDVFLSFASADKEFVKPIWQEMSLSGLRVFWSDETLKQNVGQSFFSVIQNALTNSRHFVLFCTPNSMKSNWVREEYETFFSECYIASGRTRRLIVFEGTHFDRSILPAMLKNIQSTSSSKEVISILGGINIQALINENKNLKQKIQIAHIEIDKLKNELAHTNSEKNDLIQKSSRYNAQIVNLLEKDLDVENKHKNLETYLGTLKAERTSSYQDKQVETLNVKSIDLSLHDKKRKLNIAEEVKGAIGGSIVGVITGSIILAKFGGPNEWILGAMIHGAIGSIVDKICGTNREKIRVTLKSVLIVVIIWLIVDYLKFNDSNTLLRGFFWGGVLGAIIGLMSVSIGYRKNR